MGERLMTTERKRNRFLRATPNYTHKYQPNSTVRLSKDWHRGGLIWRTLATHPVKPEESASDVQPGRSSSR
jgi:hypothetical protein